MDDAKFRCDLCVATRAVVACDVPLTRDTRQSTPLLPHATCHAPQATMAAHEYALVYMRSCTCAGAHAAVHKHWCTCITVRPVGTECATHAVWLTTQCLP